MVIGILGSTRSRKMVESISMAMIGAKDSILQASQTSGETLKNSASEQYRINVQSDLPLSSSLIIPPPLCSPMVAYGGGDC